MSLPGQVPLDQLLRQVAALFGVKALHLLAEAARGLAGARLGAALEARGRARVARAARDAGGPPPGDLARASRLLVVDAASGKAKRAALGRAWRGKPRRGRAETSSARAEGAAGAGPWPSSTASAGPT